MRIAIIDKDQFANLLKYGEIILPKYLYRYIDASEESSELKAIRSILHDGIPMEYPSQYIIVRYEEMKNASDRVNVDSIKSLMATNADSRRLFTTQFRKDLIIESEKYSGIFSDYLNIEFQKQRILKGIVAFRRMCGLDIAGDYGNCVEKIFRGNSNRIQYRHHYLLPAEEREEPYSLMISYDRHAPYPNGWVGYFCDVIETYCYYVNRTIGYSENIIQNTDIYKIVQRCGPKALSKDIYDAVKDEKFTRQADKFFYLQGGCFVPYIFFILRDRFRNEDSFASQGKLIEHIKSIFPEAFDTACTFVGGFFGYNRFYDDYYSVLNLPFIKGNGDGPEIIENKLTEDKDAENREKQDDPCDNDTSLLKRNICQAIYNSGVSSKKKRGSLIVIVQGCDVSELNEIKKLLEEKNSNDLKKKYFSNVGCHTRTFEKICESYEELSKQGNLI